MKTLLTLFIITAVIFLFPLQEAAASNALSRVFEKATKSYLPVSKSKAVMKNRQELKVKNRKQAISLVKSRYQAKVLSVNTSKVNGNPGYKAKLLGNNGTVFYVYIDAKTGLMKRS